MSIIKRMRKQKAVYWKRLSADRFGKFSYDFPVEVECRWDDTNEEFRTPKMETRVSQSIVYPDREMFVGDMLKRGEMTVETYDDPTEDPDAFEIQAFAHTPNLRNTETLFTAYL